MEVLSGFTIFVLILLALGVLLIFLGVKIVPQGNEYTVNVLVNIPARSHPVSI